MLFPTLCLGCKTTKLTSVNNLCNSCWTDLRFIYEPFCERCGIPGSCDCSDFFFYKAWAPLLYAGLVQKLIHRFKYQDEIGLYKLLSKLLLHCGGAKMLDTVDIIASVPLYWKKLMRRGYNQSALIAIELGKLSTKKVDNFLLQRIRNTQSQIELDTSERITNVADAFAVKKSCSNLKILVVDDVITTGATANECAKVLVKHGAAAVYILGIARTI